MVRLALAVAGENRLGPDRAAFRISARAGQLAYKAFGQSILIYQRAPQLLRFVGRGRVFGLQDDVPEFNLLQLVDFLSFDTTVPSDLATEINDPAVRRSLTLSEERFEEVLRIAAAGEISRQALDEANAVFAHDRESALAAYLKVHDRTLQRWRYRCVFTGVEFSPSEIRPHPQLRVVAIRPRKLGGPLHVRNYLPMVAEAEHAFRSGHITLGPGFGFQVAERHIDPEFRERLLPLGRLALPAEPSLWPDLELIAYHRNNIFDRD